MSMDSRIADDLALDECIDINSSRSSVKIHDEATLPANKDHSHLGDIQHSRMRIDSVT